MKKLAVLLLVIALALAAFSRVSALKTTSAPNYPTPTIPTVSVVGFPIAEFKQRIIKKPFGIYATDRFTGYHTGVDVEYTDTTADVPVFAIADGVIVTSEYASGYGGVMVVKNQINSQTLYVVYGHLRPSSMLGPETKVTQGQQIAVLGTGFSQETDGERRHLHFGVALTNTIIGYVPTRSSLEAGWLDPLSLYSL